MEFRYSNDGFLPYESFDYIYNERVMPEFGKVVSPYMRPLTTWKFYLAHVATEIPFGVELRSFDDTDWDDEYSQMTQLHEAFIPNKPNAPTIPTSHKLK